MRHNLTAAALAVLLLTAGIAGVVSAAPNSTDTNSTATSEVARPLPVDATDATFEERLAHRLQQYDLTDAQIREIVAEASRLRDVGASRLVVRSSIVMNLYEYGVDAPYLYADTAEERPAGDHDAFHRIIRTLDVSPEQARELHAMVHRLLDDGASREEIRRAIAAQVAEWDADAPDGVDRLVDSLVDRHDLDRVQAAELERLIRRLVDAGAHRGEIREAVARLLASYGTEDSTPTAALAR